MARVILTNRDTVAIPLGEGPYWDVIGTGRVDTFKLDDGMEGIIRTLEGSDALQFAGDATEYTVKIVGGASTSVIFTHKETGKEVEIPTAKEADLVSFAGNSPLELKFQTGEFLLGTQKITTTASEITGTPLPETYPLDGKGTDVIPFALDANADAYHFTDSFSQGNNVLITGFGDDDQITVLGATASDYNVSSNENGDVTLVLNNNGLLSTIVLMGVATLPISDVADFNALPVGDISFVA